LKVWRISAFVDLLGKGGTYASGRWHSIGRPVLYTSDHPSLATVEFLVNIGDRNLIPASTCLFSIEIPDSAVIDPVDAGALPVDWQNDVVATRSLGTNWLDRCAALALKVPTATGPSGYNYIVNPRHADAASLRIVDQYRPPFDDRLLKLK
jgi:RES domain-containing protein